MKIAVAQISCLLGDPGPNLFKVRDFSARAKQADADLIVFPEMIDTGYSMPVIRTNAASWTDGFVPELQEIARKLSIAIVKGLSERGWRIDLQFSSCCRSTGQNNCEISEDPPVCSRAD